MTVEQKAENPVKEFTTDDIKDVRILIETKYGYHYGLIPNKNEVTADQAADVRKQLLSLALTCHYVVSTPLELIK